MTLRNELSYRVKALLARLGYALVRVDDERTRTLLPSHSGLAPPAEVAALLRRDHPALKALQARYARLNSPLATPSIWTRSYLRRELDLAHFRGDNAYVWQHRNVGTGADLKYYLYAEYLEQRDSRHLLRSLLEDGAFGCLAFNYARFPTLSRDLLDSVNEIYFLDRHLKIFSQRDLRVLDIGAGYGRLAHRMTTAVEGLERYVCVDAVAESTYLSDLYLRYRGADARAKVVALDEAERRLFADPAPQLAINVHSFSEMPITTVQAWLDLIGRLGVPKLFIVPNDVDRLLSYEQDGSRIDFAPMLAQQGYVLRAQEPVIADADVQRLTGIRDVFFLFERAS